MKKSLKKTKNRNQKTGGNQNIKKIILNNPLLNRVWELSSKSKIPEVVRDRGVIELSTDPLALPKNFLNLLRKMIASKQISQKDGQKYISRINEFHQKDFVTDAQKRQLVIQGSSTGVLSKEEARHIANLDMIPISQLEGYMKKINASLSDMSKQGKERLNKLITTQNNNKEGAKIISIVDQLSATASGLLAGLTIPGLSILNQKEDNHSNRSPNKNKSLKKIDHNTMLKAASLISIIALGRIIVKKLRGKKISAQENEIEELIQQQQSSKNKTISKSPKSKSLTKKIFKLGSILLAGKVSYEVLKKTLKKK